MQQQPEQQLDWGLALPPDIQAEWSANAEWISWPHRHRESFSPGQQGYVFWVGEGLIKIGRFLPGRREDYQYLAKPGEWIGELTLVEPNFPPFFAMSAQPSRVLRLPKAFVQQGMMRIPAFNLQMLQQLGSRLQSMQARREAMIRQSAQERILAFLCEYCQQFGQEAEGQIEIQQPLNHTEISKFTATSRQSVHTLMARLRREGWLDYDQRELRVPSSHIQDIVQQIQQGSPLTAQR